jgi:DNA-binding NarL/FixJ family response regulator
VAGVKRRPARRRRALRVLIADDHDLVRRGLKRILAEAADVTVVGEARDAADVLRVVRTNPADVLLLDLSMPGTSGLDLLAAVRREYPRLTILVLSLHAEDQFAERVLAAGASGYLTKESAPDELVDAVRAVYAGGRYVSGGHAVEDDGDERDPGYPAIRFARPPTEARGPHGRRGSARRP